MFKKLPVALLLAVVLFAAACGSDDTTAVETADDATQSQPNDDGESTDLPEGPIPVEPDGGIGDGAEPLPGAEDPVDEGTWHGAIVAETNCPGMTWQRVEGSAFSFSVPSDFVAEDAMGIDSEVGIWKNEAGIEVSYDFGWYSGSISGMPGAVVEAIDYSGRIGEFAVVRSADSTTASMVGVYFGEVNVENDIANKLGLIVSHTDPADEIVGRCIVGSIEWTA